MYQSLQGLNFLLTLSVFIITVGTFSAAWPDKYLISNWTARYWQDPLVFNPERFLGNYNKDAFIPFSVGARSCIGRRYAL